MRRGLRAFAIDLIPDFIPVIGYLDDVIIVPLGVMAVVTSILPNVMAEHRELALAEQDMPVNRTAATVIVMVWIGSLALMAWLSYRFLVH